MKKVMMIVMFVTLVFVGTYDNEYDLSNPTEIRLYGIDYGKI